MRRRLHARHGLLEVGGRGDDLDANHRCRADSGDAEQVERLAGAARTTTDAGVDLLAGLLRGLPGGGHLRLELRRLNHEAVDHCAISHGCAASRE